MRARAAPDASGPPEASSPTERLIVDAHRLLHNLRGDHENVHDSVGSAPAVVAAQVVLHDKAEPTLARLNAVPAATVSKLSDVWQMLYFETRSALEFYMACGSQSAEDRTSNAKVSVADGDRTIQLLQQIASRNDSADMWILEDKKLDTVRWFQAAALGLVFQTTGADVDKEAALARWNLVNSDYRKLHPVGPASHLAGVVPGSSPPPGPPPVVPEPPIWPRVVGVSFAALAVLFLAVLIGLSVVGKDVSPQARPIVVFFFALCCAMACAFIVGSLTLQGALPFSNDKPLVVGATGGIAVLILVILIGNKAWKSHPDVPPIRGQSGSGAI